MGCLFPQQQQEKEKKKNHSLALLRHGINVLGKKKSKGYWRDELIKTQIFELMNSLGGKVQQ